MPLIVLNPAQIVGIREPATHSGGKSQVMFQEPFLEHHCLRPIKLIPAPLMATICGTC